MRRWREAAVIAALALPLVVLAAGVWQIEAERATASTWRVAIAGYDPRDLLRGHYLRFRYDWEWAAERGACPAEGGCCLCLAGDPGPALPRVRLMSCAAATACAARIAGTSDAARGFVPAPGGELRYYVPEASAAALDRLLQGGRRRLSVDLAVTAAGGTRLGELYVDDRPWREAVE